MSKKINYQMLANGILKKQGIDPKTWIETELNSKRMAILNGSDKVWAAQTRTDIYQELVLSNVGEILAPTNQRTKLEENTGGNN